MVELHGWLTVEETYADEDLLPEHEQRRIAEAVRGIIAESGLVPEYVNGACFLRALYCGNHRTPQVDAVIECFRRVAETASGSYGMIHLRDDEDAVSGNAFQVWVFRRGACIQRADTDFSPCIPVIEDASAVH